MDLEELETNLFKILVLDLLTLQTDRNARNFPIIINFKEKYLKMGKMFDNEILVNYPLELKGSVVLTINDYDMNKVIVKTSFDEAFSEVKEKYNKEEITVLFENDLPDSYMEGK